MAFCTTSKRRLSKSKKSLDKGYNEMDLPSLRRKRTIVFNRISKTLELALEASSDPTKLDLFFSYYDDVSLNVSKFEGFHFDIIELSDRVDEDETLQNKCDEMYFQIKSIYRQLNTSAAGGSKHLSNRSTGNVKLPKIKLPVFSGDIKKWPEFIDTFNALIHNSCALSDTERFHYLVSSLSGDALTVVKPFPLTHEHYRSAYNAIVLRYQNKRNLAFACWRDILNVHFNCNDAQEFRKSLDLLDENLSILKTVNLPIDQWDFVLVYHILSKLDTELRRDFEEKYCEVDLPTYAQLKLYLHSKCEAFIRDMHFSNSTKTNKQSQKSISAQTPPKRDNASYVLVTSATDKTRTDEIVPSTSPITKCSYCGDSHSIFNCAEFVKKSMDERMQIATDKRWCYNCLKPSHQLKDCKSVFSCRSCKRKHHSLLHREKSSETSEGTATLISRSLTHTTVLLATAIVQVKDASGTMQSFRALFDTGSQSNFITASALTRLNIRHSKSSGNVSGLGEVAAAVLGEVTCEVGTQSEVRFTLTFNVISSICGDQPIAKLNTSGWSHIKSLPLADPGFDIPGPIDMLFAADVFTESLLHEHVKGKANEPTALNSIFGWLLLGKTKLASNALMHSSIDKDNDLSSLVQNFWELDCIPKSEKTLTPDEALCERIFLENYSRDANGRYTVRLPFKTNDPIFENSRDVALRRYNAIERRLSRDPDLYLQYTEFMKDYIEAGHMSLVPANELSAGKYYIPHHCVLRPDSSTTRLRVVFDASAKDGCFRSLNDTQLTGPKLQPNIVGILLRFRDHEVVFMADARQMFRQIMISQKDRDYQRIFWRFAASDPLQEYRLNTVTYGVASSPYLACRTLRQLAIDDGDSYPIAKEIISRDVYVDDVASGCDSLESAQLAKTQLIALFKRGGFHLRKWTSNNRQLLSDLPKEDCLAGAVPLDNSEPSIQKVLGLKWDPSSDEFLFDIEPSERQCTKRTILSELARMFDPLGFLSPITIRIKTYIQKLWILGIGWDQAPPDDVKNTWATYKAELHQLSHLRISRRFTCSNVRSCELHGFCDSSEQAYGAVIYFRVTDESGRVHVYFVCSKARVAPLKRTSLPRLELCAAVLLADLYRFVRDLYSNIDAVYLWSDSTVVLSWLHSHSSRWATFVANRVSQIQELTPTECWHHVLSGDNPADICSRGQFPKELVNNALWWAGPCWLSQDRESWPLTDVIGSNDVEVIKEERKPVTLVAQSSENANPDSVIDNLVNRYSSFSKLLNIVAYIYRFIKNAHQPSKANRNNVISNVERKNALIQIVRQIQASSFSEEISALKENKTLSKPFRKLNVFLDDQHVLRVGGRISRSGLEFDQKHPALLPSDHSFTNLIINHIHRSHLHPGINTTHYLLLQQFWIVAAKRAIRRQLSKCVKCFKTNPQPLQPFMSDLPSCRLNQVKPFSVVGVDFGGPFRIKLGPHRGAKIDKAYLCLFVCLATKAVHLEVVSTLSTEGFIAALRRFVGRRGRCSAIHADCGTNFVGASNQLAQFARQASEAENIEFKFNPPGAPHFGGVWEIQIKAAKAHMYRVVGDQVLTFEELTTLFVQIEALLNSRPLYPISSDPNDLSCLTPGHFLTQEPLTAIPDEDLLNTNLNRLNRWQLLQAFQQNFWSRWKSEYLNSLTQRAKWTKYSKPLAVGAMVIIKDDNRSPLQWTLGRVVTLHNGGDGITRSAVVKTSNNNLLHRPLVKLCPLPIGD